MLKITIKTLYDISRTDVARKFKSTMLPIQMSNRLIESEEDWHYAKRQQSNWETVLQCISLRVQPEEVTFPEVSKESLQEFGYAKSKKGNVWEFEFVVARDKVLATDNDKIGLLRDDLSNVPLLTNLDEDADDLENQKANRYNIIFAFEEVEEVDV